ncbi:hypothetical protein FS749_015649 [Ceratobasidium sp. UAMH 11750]|nr:hypothetical protein FS749_015649 [Ceratobasidium sp. UAMH 11750]
MQPTTQPKATPPESVAPLENQSVVESMQHIRQQPEARMLRRLGSMFSRLTTENFDSASDDIIDLVNKCENALTLMRVIEFIIKMAEDEAESSEMHARLCRKMVERLSPNVQDETMRNAEGQPITGGLLFRKYLLNRCQAGFERGWSAREAAAALAASKPGDGKATEAASQANGKAALYFEEYYAAAKARRQGLGLVRFLGELFKSHMLTGRIVHECIQTLLSNVTNPKEEEIESLCELLTTAGQSLDNAKARNHMDIYFERMQKISEESNIHPRIQSMLQDVIELRHRGWQARSATLQSPTVLGAYEQAKREEAASRNAIQRGGYRRSERREDYSQRPDDKNNSGSASGFNKRGINQRGADPLQTPEIPSAHRNESTRNPSLDLRPAGMPPVEGERVRKRLILLPRTRPIENEARNKGGFQPAAAPTPEAGIRKTAPSPPDLASSQGRIKLPPLAGSMLGLNILVSPGKFVYDRNFLLQFMGVCKGEPNWITPPDTLDFAPRGLGEALNNSGGRCGGRTPEIQHLESTRPGPPNQSSPQKGFSTGSFQAPPSRLVDSRSRPGASTTATRGGVETPILPYTISQPTPVTQKGRAAVSGSKHTRRRNDYIDGMRGNRSRAPASEMAASLEPARPLKRNEDRPISEDAQLAPHRIDGRSLVDQEVRLLLDKLEVVNFDSISDQILDWMNGGKQEKTEAMLLAVIKLIFGKAKDKAEFSGMYARLCRKMMEHVWPSFQDDARWNAKAQPLTGGYIFYDCLFKQCRKELVHRQPPKTAALGSSNSYAAADAKRQALGCMRFVGELLNLQMIPGRFIHEHAKELLLGPANPEEEDIEGLCELLKAAGHTLDNPRTRNSMDFYFGHIKAMSRKSDIDPNVQLMLQDMIEFRQRGWQPRPTIVQPLTTLATHEQDSRSRVNSPTAADMPGASGG